MLLLITAVMYCQSARPWAPGGLATQACWENAAQKVGILLNFKIRDSWNSLC